VAGEVSAEPSRKTSTRLGGSFALPVCPSTLSDDLLEANAQWVVTIPAVSRDASISSLLVQPDRGRLSHPSFELKRIVSEIAPNRFEGRQNLSADPQLLRLRFDEYPSDFGDTGSELPNRSATDSSPVLTRHDEGRAGAAEIKREKFSSIDVAVEPIQLGPRMIAQKQTFVAPRISERNRDGVFLYQAAQSRMIFPEFPDFISSKPS
jgi:hypothetical protein